MLHSTWLSCRSTRLTTCFLMRNGASVWRSAVVYFEMEAFSYSLPTTHYPSWFGQRGIVRGCARLPGTCSARKAGFSSLSFPCLAWPRQPIHGDVLSPRPRRGFFVGSRDPCSGAARVTCLIPCTGD